MYLGGITQFVGEIAFDADDRVLSVQWPHLVNSGRPQVQQFGYDEQARLLKLEQGYGTWDGTKWTFTEYSAFHDFHLDEQGNWAEHQDGAGTTLVSPTIAKDNAYTAWPVSGGSTLSFVLDDAGRFVYERPVTGGGKYLYKHDGLGRLVSAQRISVPGKADLTTTYGYTADGRLAWRKEGTAAREWLIYDGSQAVVQTTDTALSWTHVWAGSRLVRTTKNGPGTVYHPHQDRLGSIVVVTRSGGPDRALYDPYGRLVAAFSTITSDTFAVPFGYAGARWEATAGLYQMGARWYDPELGRFIEQDPIGEAGGLNLYAYVGSSPTLWVDPTGLNRAPIESAPTRRNPRTGTPLNPLQHWKNHPEDFVRVNEAPVEPGTSDPDAEGSPQEDAREEATQGATTPADARAGQECLDGATVTRPGGPDAKSKGDKFDPPPGAESVRKGDHALVVYGAETFPAADELGNKLEGKPVKANAKALQKYLEDKGAIVTAYPGDSKFLEWFNSQKEGAFNAGFFLGHNDEGAFKMTDGTSFTTENAAQMRSGVMAKGATWTWAGCGTANSGTVNDFVSVSWFNQSGTTWGERGGRGYFDVVDWKNSQRPTVGTGISFPEGGGWEGVAPLNGGAR